MWTVVALSLLTASPELRAEVSTEFGVSFTGDMLGFGPTLAGRLDLVHDDERFIFSGWAQPMWWPGSEAFWGVQHHVSGRYVFGRFFTVGLEGEFRNVRYHSSGEWIEAFSVHAGGGPCIGLLFGDRDLRFEFRAAWLPLSNVPDLVRLDGTGELAWKMLSLRAVAGIGQLGWMRRDPMLLMPNLSIVVGVRFRW